MTKKTKNLVIAAGLIGLAGSIGAIAGLSPTLAGGRTLAPGHANADAATALGITADIDSRIAVDVANQALPGEIVDVELTYDHDLITINDLLVNGGTAAKVDEESYYFEMPDEAVTLTVDAIIEGEYHLVNLNPNVELYGYDELGFDAGDEVTLSIGLPVDTAYTITDVEIGALNDEGTAIETPISYTYQGGNAYTFTAPEGLTADVGVYAHTETKMFALETQGSNIDYVYEVIGEERTEVSSRAHAYAGATIEVYLEDTAQALATGLRIVETGEEITPILQDETLVCTFTMPARDITIEAITTPNYIPLAVTQGEHVTVTPSTYDSETGELTPSVDEQGQMAAVPNTSIYLDWESDDGNHAPYQFRVEYAPTWNPDYTSNLTVMYDDEVGLYYFNMQDGADFEITYTEVEKQNLTLLDDTLSTYYNVDETYVATSTAYAGEEVYVHVDGVESEDDVLTLIVSYVDADGLPATIGTEWVGDGYFVFEMEEGTDYTIDVSMYDPTAYEGYEFVGDYVGGNAYAYSGGFHEDTLDTEASIGADGAVTARTSGTIIKVTPLNEGGTCGILDLTGGHQGAYGEGFYVIGYSGGLYTHDYMIYAKTELGTSLTGRILVGKVDGVDGKMVFFEIASTVDGVETVVASFAIDGINHTCYLEGVSYTYEGGAGLEDATSVTLNVDGAPVGTIAGTVYTPAA